jgi:UDP-N-acetylmuramyl pentapeptide phosphotransferase/UDP-N-acetylglucosamine-1-phosphate transferase
MLNFPFGKIFLGDAGAYGIGFILSWMSLDVLMEAPEMIFY